MKKYYLFLMTALVFPVWETLAMSSGTYKIDLDVFSSGGDLGTSASYHLTDTIGEAVIGSGTSATYKTADGFWQGLTDYISLDLDAAIVNLGTITPGSPITGQSVVTVKTDAWGGYDLYIRKDTLLKHTDTVTTIADYPCAINSPCLWSGTGFGFTIISGTNVDAKWGSNPNYKFAAIPESDTLFHRKTGFLSTDDVTTTQYKLDVPASQKSGAYEDNVTYTAMARL